LHDEAVALGAVFENVGAWKRAHYFPRSGEIMPAAVARECTSVRTCVGLTDASTLGKIEMAGPDAARFVELIYTGYWPRLAPGQCRYALVLKDDGFVFDDGIVARLSADRFHVTTTTGGAARVLHHMEDYRQTEWPHLKVWLTSVTEHWAVIAVQGPKSREILERHVEGIDLATTAMPYMSVRTGRICGVPTRLFRVGFTGELGYEVNVPAAMAPAVWRTLLAEAIRCGGGAYGTEAMHVLRAEKGYVLVGQETDGTVTADDLGLGAMVGHAKPDFVGKRGLARADLVASGRRQLVGLLTEDPALVLEEGAQVTMSAVPVIGSHVAGYVTSSYMSPTLGRSIALALIERGRALKGERVFVPLPGRVVPAIVTASVFYDPEGARLRA
jgi:sarcosine oxidase subunit alpha